MESVESCFQSPIEHTNANVQETLDSRPGPPHPLSPDPSFRDYFVDRRFDEPSSEAVSAVGIAIRLFIVRGFRNVAKRAGVFP